MPVRGCRVRSSEASFNTISHRTKTLSQLRDTISGGDTSLQLQSELRVLNKEEREEVLRGVGLPVRIPPAHALALKADLGLPWAKMREISKYAITIIYPTSHLRYPIDG